MPQELWETWHRSQRDAEIPKLSPRRVCLGASSTFLLSPAFPSCRFKPDSGEYLTLPHILWTSKGACSLYIPFLRHLLSVPGAPQHIPSAVHRTPRSSWNPPPTPAAQR